MGRGKKPLLEKVKISKIAAEGKSIAYVDDKVLFVPNTVPGDIVDVQVTRKRKSFLEGYVTHMHRIYAFPPSVLISESAEDVNGKTCLTKNNWNSNNRKSPTICNESVKSPHKTSVRLLVLPSNSITGTN